MVSVLLPTGQLPGTIYVDSQFRFDVLPGVHNGCGVAAVDMVESYGQQSYVGFTAMYAKMRGRGLANADGMTNTGWIAKELTLDGFAVQSVGGGSQAWVIARLQEGKPVIGLTSHGQVLKDLITGQPMDATNLASHFDTFVGYWAGGFNSKANKVLPAGFWFMDSDSGATNPIVNGKRERAINWRNLQFYSADNVRAAGYVALLAVTPKVKLGGPQFLTLPAYPGWRYDAAANILYPPSYHPTDNVSFFEKGFARFVWAEIQAGRWDKDQEPMGREFVVPWVEEANHVWGNGSIIILRYGYLAWSQPKSVIYRPYAGQELREFRKRLGLAYQAA